LYITGNYSVNGTFDMTMTFSSSYSYTWVLEAFKNGVLIDSSTQTFAGAVNGNKVFMYTGSSGVDVCAASNTKVYFSSKNLSLGQYLTTGDPLYTDIALSIPATFPAGKYVRQNGGDNNVYAISTGGVIGALETSC
jgi:hypothetical protein